MEWILVGLVMVVTFCMTSIAFIGIMILQGYKTFGDWARNQPTRIK